MDQKKLRFRTLFTQCIIAERFHHSKHLDIISKKVHRRCLKGFIVCLRVSLGHAPKKVNFEISVATANNKYPSSDDNSTDDV